MNFLTLHSVGVWRTEYPEFELHKEEILNSVRQYKEENPISINTTNISGYQSPKFLHTKENLNPLFNYIASLANKACDELNFCDREIYITSSWVNFNDSRQCMISEHTHNDTFSGVFYLKCPSGSGNLCFPNTSMNTLWMGLELCEEKNELSVEKVKVDPIEGDIFLWPSYIPHSVETNDHDEERISISFNIIVFKKNNN